MECRNVVWNLMSHGYQQTCTGSLTTPVHGHPRIVCLQGRTEEDAECVVCQEEMEVGALVTHLPCKHGFHAACAQQWLSRQPTCPT